MAVTVLRRVANNYSVECHMAYTCSAHYRMAHILFCLTPFPVKNILKQGDA